MRTKWEGSAAWLPLVGAAVGSALLSSLAGKGEGLPASVIQSVTHCVLPAENSLPEFPCLKAVTASSLVLSIVLPVGREALSPSAPRAYPCAGWTLLRCACQRPAGLHPVPSASDSAGDVPSQGSLQDVSHPLHASASVSTASLLLQSEYLLRPGPGHSSTPSSIFLLFAVLYPASSFGPGQTKFFKSRQYV